MHICSLHFEERFKLRCCCFLFFSRYFSFFVSLFFVLFTKANRMDWNNSFGGEHNFHYSMKFIFSLEAKTIMLRLLPWSTIHKHNCMHGTCTRSFTRSALAQIINIYSTMTIKRSALREPLRFLTHTNARIKKLNCTCWSSNFQFHYSSLKSPIKRNGFFFSS